MGRILQIELAYNYGEIWPHLRQIKAEQFEICAGQSYTVFGHFPMSVTAALDLLPREPYMFGQD